MSDAGPAAAADRHRGDRHRARGGVAHRPPRARCRVERIADAAGRISAGRPDAPGRPPPRRHPRSGGSGAAFDGMLDQLAGRLRRAARRRSTPRPRARSGCGASSPTPRTSSARPSPPSGATPSSTGPAASADPTALAGAMDRIEGESQRMGTLVDDLLLLARLDQGRPLRRDAVDLSRVCTDAVADLRASEPVASGGGGRSNLAWCVAGDDDRLRQVVGNLLANVARPHARRDADRGGAPSTATPDGSRWAELRVVDHGPGIPPEHALARVRPLLPGRRRDARARPAAPGLASRSWRPSWRRTVASSGTRPRPGAARRSGCGSRSRASRRRSQPPHSPRSASPEAPHRRWWHSNRRAGCAPTLVEAHS